MAESLKFTRAACLPSLAPPSGQPTPCSKQHRGSPQHRLARLSGSLGPLASPGAARSQPSVVLSDSLDPSKTDEVNALVEDSKACSSQPRCSPPCSHSVCSRPSSAPLEAAHTGARRPDSLLRVEDLRVWAPGRRGRPGAELLRGVSAEVRSGRVLAVLGGSGAGKTTLLNALAPGQLPRGLSHSGEVTFNGRELSQQLFLQVGSYVEQIDALWPMLTVGETLQFAAGLFQGHSSSQWQKAKVEAVLREMGLAACRDVVVGDGVLLRGTSGGQRRRLSIAVGLMKRPSVLVLDEPTSGLDSAAAEAIVDLLAAYATEHNIGVACTIHQPSSYTFRRFDQLLVLAAGRACYAGPAAEALAHFDGLGHACDPGLNPAEFLLRKTNPDFGSAEEVQLLCDAWEAHQEASAEVEDPSHICFSMASGYKECALEGAGLARQCHLLGRRALLGHLRNPAVLVGRTLFGAAGVAFIAFAYLQARERRQEDVLDRVWAVMWLQQLPGFLVVGTIPSFAQEGVCVRRELRNGMFGALNYLLADFLVSVPLWFIVVLLSILPGMAVLDMNWASLPQIWLLVTAYVGMCHTMAQLCGAVFESPALGTVAFISQTIVNMVFNGAMLARVESLHWSIRWISAVVPSKYSFRSGALLEFRGLEFEGFEYCSDPGLDLEQRLGLPCWGRAGTDVIRALAKAMFPVLTARDTLIHDLGIIMAWTLCLKALHALVLLRSLQLLPQCCGKRKKGV